MSSYLSINNQITKILTDIAQKKFYERSNNYVTTEDKSFLKRKITSIEKVVEEISELNIGSGKIDRNVMQYIKALMVFTFFQDIYVALDFSVEYCLQYLRDTDPKRLQHLTKILQSSNVWGARIMPADFLHLLIPQMSQPVREVVQDMLTKNVSWKAHWRFDIGSLRNDINNTTLSYKKSLLKRIGLWMASKKIKRPEYGLITEELLSTIIPQLESGDILLTRGNWNLTNTSIPGFWKHMSLYVGDGDICEAVGAGIQKIHIGHLLTKNDYCLVLRTNFSNKKKQKAISYVLKQVGKSYDFTFNYYCDTSAVCSALVTKAYLPERGGDEGLQIELLWTGGAYTYPPNNLVKKMDTELGTEKEQIYPVIFIDTYEKIGEASIKPPLESRKTWKRSRWCLLQK